MSCTVFQQDILDKRIVTVDFAPWLGSGPSIASVVWTVPSGLTQADSSNTSTTATNYFSSATDDKEYAVKCTITTNEPVTRKKTEEFIIRVQGNCD